MLNPLNPLSKHLLDGTLEETERLTEALPKLPLDEGTALRLRRRVLDAAERNKAAGDRAVRETRTAPRKKAETRRKTQGRALPWLAAAACLLLVIGGVLSVPGVAKALRDLIYPEYRGASRYLTEQPENRTPVADIAETLSASAPQDVSYKIELLGEYEGNLTPYDEEYNANIGKLRADMGCPAFDKEAFAFLRDIRPEVREVLYDGEQLLVNTFLYTDHVADFATGWGVNVDAKYRLDISCFDYRLSVNGADLTERYNMGFSSGTAMTVAGQSPAQIENAEGVWHTVDCDRLPEPLPDGVCTLTLLYYIYDGAIDDMGAVGNIGRIIHTISFDTRPGNHIETAKVSAPLSGGARITVSDWSSNPVIYNVEKHLDGVTLHGEAKYTGTGIKLRVTADGFAADWTEWEKKALLTMGEREGREGLCFDLYVDGALVKTVQSLAGPENELRLELPVFPADYAAIREIRLVPGIVTLESVTAFAARGQGEGTGGGEPFTVPNGRENAKSCPAYIDPVFSYQELTGCGFVIPLPKS